MQLNNHEWSEIEEAVGLAIEARPNAPEADGLRRARELVGIAKADAIGSGAARPSLLAALGAAVLMLDIEADSHEASGDPKRRKFAPPIRQAAAFGRSALRAAGVDV